MSERHKLTDTAIVRALTKAGLPSQSVALGASLGAPAAVVIVWLIQAYLLTKPMPSEVAAAAGALVTAGISYFFRGGRRAHE